MIIKKISETVWKEIHWSNIKSCTRIKLTTGTEDETVVEGVADWQSLNFLHINNPDSLGAIVILNITYPKLLDTYTFYVQTENQKTVVELEDGDYLINPLIHNDIESGSVHTSASLTIKGRPFNINILNSVLEGYK